MTGIFRRIVVCDTEYEVTPGGLPNLLCLVAYVLDENLQHVRTIRLWRGEFGSKPPFDVGPNTLFVAYSAWAELTVFAVMCWSFPVHVFDLHTAYLATSNFLLPYDPDEKRIKPRKRLSDACRAYGIEGWENIDKKQIAEDIGNGLWRKYGQQVVFDYCEEDVRKSTQLLLRQLRGRDRLSIELVLHWSNYSAKSIALIQSRGIPIDTFLWNLVQENKAAVIRALVQQFDPSYGSETPIFTEEGEWSYARFERWLVQVGVVAWPRLESGQLDVSSDAFRLMQYIPGIEALHMLRDVIGFIAKARLPIGVDGRNRPSLFPFGTATGRNAHAKSPFNAHAGVRSFITFPSDSIGVYLDWRTQEVGVAASRSRRVLKRALDQQRIGGATDDQASPTTIKIESHRGILPMTDLTKYTAAKQALAAAVRVDEVKDIRDKAAAMRLYAMQARDRVLIDQATEIRLRAERRAGELLREMADRGERHRRGDSNQHAKSQAATLQNLNINKSQSARWQKLADVHEDDFEELVTSAKQKACGAVDRAQQKPKPKGKPEPKKGAAATCVHKVGEIVRAAVSKIPVEERDDLHAQLTELISGIMMTARTRATMRARQARAAGNSGAPDPGPDEDRWIES